MATPSIIVSENQTLTSSGKMSISEAEHQPLAKDKFTFLKELTSAEEYHGEKSFYQHLVNVYNYLESQSLPQEVCDAGLFHSVYGTEFYHFSSASITRDVVRGYIGEYAEELAHTFCGLRKDRFLSILNNVPGWDKQKHLDLCRLEHANFWDGRNDRDVKSQMDALSKTIAQLESKED
ncbi:hypothetical protein PFICI_14226 [Pestalotiopsis fici W106-1]|uniref:DUF6817 domain-containing protein n=1 Tax=Pestalotiopsis fici (strain W106-1 / CGMCC3.15140) TaxID=1229662 RepID=W3WKB1_PESFW|nr:uncharacterized protein PFICI_14226 [Pestalotiopsis fici W106-1]ETS74360.1 hypothetical protein PFICI_14226 [Pestalotiopsis fici W106-1]